MFVHQHATHPITETQTQSIPQVCPICGAMVESSPLGKKKGWTCLMGGYAHYYQAHYGYLKQWFTSGEGNLREPVIRAMNCAA